MPVTPILDLPDPGAAIALPWGGAGPVEATLLSGQVIVAGFSLSWTTHEGWSPVIVAGFSLSGNLNTPNFWTGPVIESDFTCLYGTFAVSPAPSTTPTGIFFSTGSLPA